MTDKPDHPARSDGAFPAHQDSPASDVKVLAEAIIDLNIVRKNMMIYPASHEQVQRSLERAYGRMDAILSKAPAVTLAVLSEGLMVGPHTLDSKGSVIKELAQSLRIHEVGAITFSRGLVKAGLLEFLQLVIASRTDVQALGGIEAAVAERVIAGITVQAVDYSKIKITEENEIQRPGGQQPESSHWQDFVYQLLAGSQGKAEIKDGLQVADHPTQLASLLDRHRPDLAKAVAQYEKCLLSHAKQPQDPQLMSPVLAASLQNFHELIKALNPELQKQFLSVAVDHCKRSGPSAQTANLMRGLGQNLVVRMLRQANTDGRQVSPSMMAFVKKLGHLPQGSKEKQLGTTDAGKDDLPGDLSADQIQTLLAREDYERFVDDQYDQKLKGLAAEDETSGQAAAIDALRSELLVSLEEGQINCHVGRVLDALMEASTDLESYRDWARQLTFVLDDLVGSKTFACLMEIYHFVRREQEVQRHEPEKLKIAGLVLKHFTDNQFVAKAVACVDQPRDRIDDAAFEFLALLGEPVVVEVFECLGTKDLPDRRSGLVHLLDRFGSLAAQEALERLNDPRHSYIRLMLHIFRRLGNSDLAENVRPLVDHPDQQIRLDALAILVKFNNPWGLIHLRDLIQEPWSPSVKIAIRMAGHYRVQEAVPLLTALVTRRGSLAADLERREAALRALGKIGDARVLPKLDKLARRRWSFSKKHLRHLKRALFESLEGYPRKAAERLLRFGLKQRDETIQAICERLLNQPIKQNR